METDKKSGNHFSKSDWLRKRAEEIVFDRSEQHEAITVKSPEEIKKLVHDLSVYQIELEMQNDELLRIRNELQNSRNKYTHLYDFSPIGYFTISEKGIIDEANLTGADMFGVERNSLIGLPFSRFVHTQDHDSFYKHQQKLFETGIPLSIELRLLSNGGHVFYAHFECMTVTDTVYRHRQIRAAVNDITDRKTAEAALLQSEERYRSMLETMQDATYICSADYRIEFLNPRMISRIGYDATGEVCYKAIYHQEEKCSQCDLDKVSQGMHIEYERISPVDNRNYNISSSPIYHPDGSVSKFTISRDITRRKQMEKQLRQTHKMEAIGTLAGGIAHDFNNILYMIIGNSEVALDKLPEGSPVQNNLDKIKTAALRAADIVKQLLDFSRKIDQELNPVNAVTVVKDLLRFLRPMIPSSIDIRTHLAKMNISILADANQIRQALINICINSFQAMEKTGGVLEIAVEKETLSSELDDHFCHLPEDTYVKISISDTGPGINTECIENIFDPYFTTRKTQKGSGLGLAVVHGIVTNHNGGITVDSHPGGGTTFNLYFPAIPEQPAIGTKAQEVFPPGKEKILFVDDEEFIADLAQEMLSLLGYRVEARRNPQDALELFLSAPHKFDLVITDMTMPQMNGIKLSEKIRAVRPDIPVIICTGHSPLIDEESARNKGFSAYITKPIVMSDIAKTIRNVLDKE